MVLFLGLFLINTLCAIVPCQRNYNYPVPVPKEDTKNANQPYLSFNQFTIPIIMKERRSEREELVVETEAGLVEGFPMKTIRARDIVAFYGIPFAEPPVRTRRYKPPIPKKPWSGVLQANKLPDECVQIDGSQLLRIVGNEDCLYLNVYTPNLPRPNDKSKPLPVIVFIHGGSFAFSTGSKFGPSYLLDHDVLLVTFNYRLSSFGFLTTGDETLSGNWGMKDQVLVLQWVHKNIGAFGGDKDKVTLVGQSAGGVSVQLHMMSPRSQGLFNSGISQSGNAFTFWAVRNDESIEYTYRLASAVKCPINDTKLMVNCLRKLDPLFIAYAEAQLPSYKVFPGVFFGPVVEPKGPNAFLEDRPEVLYAQNRVPPIPWINGFLPGEGNGIGFLSWLYPFVMQELNQKWATLGPSVLDLRGQSEHMAEVAKHIRKHYFGDERVPISYYTRKNLMRMMGDRLIIPAIHQGLKYHSRIAPTYGYFFNYTGRYGIATVYGLNNQEWGPISHDDDLLYLFNSTTYPPMKVGEPEQEMSAFMTNVWASFAHHSEPTFKTDSGKEIHFWDPIQDFKADNLSIVLLDGDMPKMITFPYLDRIKFWKDLGLVSRSKVGPYTLMDNNNINHTHNKTEFKLPSSRKPQSQSTFRHEDTTSKEQPRWKFPPSSSYMSHYNRFIQPR